MNVYSICTTKLVSVDGGKRQYFGRFVDPSSAYDELKMHYKKEWF